MLHIVLTILKILGILLLSILALLLVLVLCILFLPLRYQAHLVYHGEWNLHVKVSYLLGIITFHYKKNGDSGKKLKVFGINTHFFEEKEEKKSKKKKMKKTEKRKKKQKTLETENVESVLDTESEVQEQDVNVAEPLQTDSLYQPRQSSNEESNEEEEQQKSTNGEHRQTSRWKKKLQQLIRKIKSIPKKIRYIFRKICGTIKKIKEKITEIYEFLKDEAVWQALKDVKAELKNLLGHMRPRKVKGYVHFGFENPATTGTVCGMIYSFYGVLPKKLKITTDFEQQILDGDILIKGRIYVFYLLIRALKIYKNPNIKKVLEKRRNHGREE